MIETKLDTAVKKIDALAKESKDAIDVEADKVKTEFIQDEEEIEHPVPF